MWGFGETQKIQAARGQPGGGELEDAAGARDPSAPEDKGAQKGVARLDPESGRRPSSAQHSVPGLSPHSQGHGPYHDPAGPQPPVRFMAAAHPCHSAAATPTSLQFLEQIWPAPASGPVHCLFPLPGMLFQMPRGCSLRLLRSLLACRLLSEAPPDP